MIAPAVTVWPPNTLTPRRLELESRPFFEEPRPFLCAISSVSFGSGGLGLGLAARAGCCALLERNLGDRHLGEAAAMAAHLLARVLRLVGEHADLRPQQVRVDGRRDGDLRELLRIEDRGIVVGGEEHRRRECLTLGLAYTVDSQVLALTDAVLLAA